MHWVKLTQVRDGPVSIWVNLERFDKIFRSGDHVTILRATLSETDEDYCDVEVLETPEGIIGLAEK